MKTNFLFAALFTTLVSVAMAQGTYTQIDFPGAMGTELWNIDSAGDITGEYCDLAGTPHGFLLKHGIYTIIDYPGATGTFALGINESGQQIVGFTPNPEVGFLYDIQSQSFTTISYPGARNTQPYAINDQGMIAGTVYRGNAYYGFELISGGPGRLITVPSETQVNVLGLSGTGEAVGYYVDASADYRAFSYRRGNTRRLNIPGTPNAQVIGVNPAGTAVVGWSGTGPTGFVYQGGTVQTLLFPSSFVTFPSGINASGEVVGYFQDSAFVYHGFLWTPPADAKGK